MSSTVLFYALLVLSLIAFVLYGADKEKAVRRARRIPEKTLLLSAAFGGALGALLGMLVFRHKTKHPRFMLGVPLMLVGWAVLLLLGWKYGLIR